MVKLADEKTEEPTQHRLMEARKKGQTAKSQEIATAATFIAVYLFFMSQGKRVFLDMADYIRTRIALAPSFEITLSNFRGEMMSVLMPFATILIPLLLLVLGMAVLGNILQTGVLFSFESISPKLSKINPVEGFKKIFSQKSLVELLKTIAKIAILILIFRNILIKNMPLLILSIVELPLMGKIETIMDLAGTLSLRIIIALGVMAALDYAYQRYDFRKQMMMSKQELKEEIKSTDGNPMIKQRIRMQQREMSKKRMLQGVKDSRVVVTNPTHYAVALKYDEELDEAPIVTAKGKDHFAKQIKELAEKHQVPIYENPPLARSLYKEVEVDDSIPPDMYRAVAEVIAFVEKLNYLKSGGLRVAEHRSEETKL